MTLFFPGVCNLHQHSIFFLRPIGRMLLIPGTGNGERGTGNGELGTGVWELMYSGNPLENSKWRSKQKKGSKRNNLGKGEFPPAVPPDGQYVIVRAESD